MSELLDSEMLNELKEIMEDDFSSLLETFLVESEKQYKAVQAAWQNQNMDELRRAAHTLKGSCGNIGAMPLRDICEGLEHDARDAQTDRIPDLLANTEQQLSEVHQELKRRFA